MHELNRDPTWVRPHGRVKQSGVVDIRDFLGLAPKARNAPLWTLHHKIDVPLPEAGSLGDRPRDGLLGTNRIAMSPHAVYVHEISVSDPATVVIQLERPDYRRCSWSRLM